MTDRDSIIDPNRPLSLQRYLLSGLGWLVPTLLFATQNYLTLVGAGRRVTWLFLFYRELPVWMGWWLFSPLIGLLVRRFPIGPETWRGALLVHVPLGLGLAFLSILFVVIVRDLAGIQPVPEGALVERVTRGLIASWWLALMIHGGIVVVDHALEYYRAYRRRELRASQLEARLAQARLETLENQLRPHFLFNTLHAISALMSEDIRTARRMIVLLSDLLRLSLRDDGLQETPLADELEFLRRYIEIQQMRFHDRLEVSVRANPRALDVLVPRLLLQPLVENAVRHGVERHARRGTIVIAAEIAAEATGDMLVLSVEDDGPGVGDGPAREGIGLRNTRERLDQLYGDRHRFEIANRPTGGTRATIELPVRTLMEKNDGAENTKR